MVNYIVRGEGFKGAKNIKYELGKYNYIYGPNGAGKSRLLQAVHFAVSGKPPLSIGKSNQVIGELFGQTGFCEIEDTSKNWIRHEIQRKAASVSVKATCSDTLSGKDEKPDLSRWAGNSMLLDFEEFEAMPAGEKGKYILNLCQEPELEPTNKTMRVIEEEAARLAVGRSATRAVFKSMEGVPEEFQPIVSEFTGDRGILQELKSHLRETERPSVSCLKLLTASKERLNSIRNQIRTNNSAIENMRASVGRTVDKNTLNAYIRQRDFLARSIERAEKAIENLESKEGLYKKAKFQAESDRAAIESFLAKKRELPPAGEVPAAPADSEELKAAHKELRANEERVKQVETFIQEINNLEEQKNRLRESGYAIEKALSDHDNSTETRLYALVDGIDDKCHPNVPHAKECVKTLRRQHDKSIKGKKEELQDLKAQAEKLSKKIAGMVESNPETQLKLLKSAGRAVETHIESLEQEHESLIARFNEELSQYNARVTALSESETKLATLRERHDRSQKDLRVAEKELSQAKSEWSGARVDTLDVMKRDHAERSEKVTEAEDANKRKTTLEEAERLLTYGDHIVQAWIVTVEALKKARDRFLADAARGLLDEANKIYKRARPDERIDIQLETPTGKTTCVFAINRGGVTITERAMSVGEWCLVLSAFSLAAAGRSRGKRMLLIEAQSLDPFNMALLLYMLSPKSPTETHLVIVASTVFPGQMPQSGRGVPEIWEWIEITPVEMDVKSEAFAAAKRKAEVANEDYLQAVREWYKPIAKFLNLKPISRIGASRKKKLLATKIRDATWMERISACYRENEGLQHCMGIGIDWFVKEANIVKMEERKYGRRTSTVAKPGGADGAMAKPGDFSGQRFECSTTGEKAEGLDETRPADDISEFHTDVPATEISKGFAVISGGSSDPGTERTGEELSGKPVDEEE